jgi:hypothetical protein
MNFVVVIFFLSLSLLIFPPFLMGTKFPDPYLTRHPGHVFVYATTVPEKICIVMFAPL